MPLLLVFLLFAAQPAAPPVARPPHLMRAAPADTLRLADLRRAAVAQDPRLQQIALHAAATDFRLDNLGAARLPQLRLNAQGTYQSDVVSLPIQVPGVTLPTFSHDRYQITLDAEQLLYDGGAVGRRQAVEAASRDVRQQAVRVDLHTLKTRVNDAFFQALLLQEQTALLGAFDADLAARLRQVEARIRAGAALPADADALRARRLDLVQQQIEADAGRLDALDALRILTGLDVPDDAVLPLPDATSVPPDSAEARPEYALFDRRHDLLNRRADLAAVERRPRLVAFAQTGYGRPGLNPFEDTFQPYWQSGLRLQWTVWDWRTSRRERAALDRERALVATEEAAFRRGQRLDLQRTRRTLARLDEALRLDDELVALRTNIARQGASRLENGTLTPADYVELRTDVYEAELAREVHRIRRSQAAIDLLTILGTDLP